MSIKVNPVMDTLRAGVLAVSGVCLPFMAGCSPQAGGATDAIVVPDALVTSEVPTQHTTGADTDSSGPATPFASKSRRVTRPEADVVPASYVLAEAAKPTVPERWPPELVTDPMAVAAPAEDEAAMPVIETTAVFDMVRQRAGELAKKAYSAPGKAEPFMRDLTYDDYRKIRFREDKTLFAAPGQPYQAKLDTRGSLFETPIRVNIVRDGVIEPYPYKSSDFNFDTLGFSDEQKQKLELAGFRLVAPLNRASKLDEVISVKGASFFRALGAGNHYGASSRGISLKTASPDGEEFPQFREIWLEAPKMGDEGFTFYALMDGPSVTGAYKFNVYPGVNTIVDVEAQIFARKELRQIGLAPLTSMFQFSPHDPDADHDDFRPRVHDSEGMAAMLANGEWIWRPLTNPRTLKVSSFASNVPQGFGLIQRARRFEDYQDFEAAYETRPTVWVTPREGWSEGELLLVEIPTPNEYNDNIIAYWQMRQPLPAGSSHRVTYRMNWGLDTPFRPALSTVRSTRTGLMETGGNRLFIVDFDLERPELFDDIEPEVSASTGKITHVNLIADEERRKVRLTFQLAMDGNAETELRAVLNLVGQPVSETWLYRWSET